MIGVIVIDIVTFNYSSFLFYLHKKSNSVSFFLPLSKKSVLYRVAIHSVLCQIAIQSVQYKIDTIQNRYIIAGTLPSQTCTDSLTHSVQKTPWVDERKETDGYK